MRFIKVNEFKLTPVELSFFHFKFIAVNASELLCMAYLASNEDFLYHAYLIF